MSGQKKNYKELTSAGPYRYGALLGLWCVIIFLLSSVPGNQYPQVTWAHADKLVHFSIYLAGGGLAALWYASRKQNIFWSFVFCACYGLSDEIHQLMVPRRSFSLADLTADCAGAATGAILFAVITTYKPHVVHKLLGIGTLPDTPERMKTT